MSGRVDLSQVTLCAAASVNVAATIASLERCLGQAGFGRALLFTHQPTSNLPDAVELITIAPLRSIEDYSRFLLRDLVNWIDTSHCLVAQWDGFIVDATAWDPAFLNCDYIGAPWPQFADRFTVGNGGFSLRSKRLLDACLNPRFVHSGGAEDIAICRQNRPWLEQDLGLRFADQDLASRFSFERTGHGKQTFGFHGAFNLPSVIGVDEFWKVYLTLDETTAVRTDFWPLLGQVAQGHSGLRRGWKMVRDRCTRSARQCDQADVSQTAGEQDRGSELPASHDRGSVSRSATSWPVPTSGSRNPTKMP